MGVFLTIYMQVVMCIYFTLLIYSLVKKEKRNTLLYKRYHDIYDSLTLIKIGTESIERLTNTYNGGSDKKE